MARHKRARQRSKDFLAPEISLTPLIDTVLVLLIIFMITTPIMEKMYQLNIELPTTSTDEAIQKEDDTSVMVYIDKDRALYINEKMVKKEQFFNELERLLKGKQATERVVFVKADRSIPYGDVVRVVDDIKYLGGVRYVALATQGA